MPWFKGNLHTHTNLSDGDSPPDLVARWYGEAGYDFLCISDHNFRFDPTALQIVLEHEGARLSLIPAEELSSWWQGPDRVFALHVNGYGTSATQGEADGGSVPAVLQTMIDRIEADGGLASVNHPNFWASVSWSDLAALQRLTFFEVYNGHPLTFDEGTDELPSMDLVWDLLLSQGQRVWGLAVDDAHYFQEWGPEFSNPGRGWVMVEATESRAGPILEALARGRFYASNGPELESIEVQGGDSLHVVAKTSSLIEFIADGQVVDKVEGEEGFCRVGRARYLRARVSDASGTAWIQPVLAD